MSSGDAQKIKDRLDLAELISSYLTLQKAGQASFRARCPFHQEKTPSFYVSKERQMWHCFGCGEGGDHFSFVQKMEHIEFPEALRILALKAGVELEGHRPEVEDARRRLLRIIDAAADFWSSVLWTSPAGALARDYVARRNVDEQTARAFRLGYAPDAWEAMVTELTRRGFRPDELVAAGIAVRRERGSGIYDRFRGRLMFPIATAQGNTVGFTGRILDSVSTEAKYVNTPETELYKKGTLLYGLDRAKQAIRTAGYALLVEGNMDVIACHRAGDAQAVASSGTALTNEQFTLLRKFTDTVYLALDADAAGEAARTKAAHLAFAHDFNVRVVRLLPGDGKDADECITLRPETWRARLNAVRPYMDDFFDVTASRGNLKSAEGKRAIADAVLGEIAQLSDPVLQAHWLGKLASLLSVPEMALREKLRGAVALPHPAPPKHERAAMMQPEVRDRSLLVAHEFLGLLLADPAGLKAAGALIRPDMLPDAATQDLYTRMLVWYTQGRSYEEYAADDPLLRTLLIKGEAEIAEKTEEDIRRTLKQLASLLREQFHTRERRLLSGLIATAERRGDTEAVLKHSRRFQEIISQEHHSSTPLS